MGDFAVRGLCHALILHRDEGDQYGPMAAEMDNIRNEVLPKLRESLPKVPNDSGAGDVFGCRGFKDRLKRMEMSAITQFPLWSASRFQKMIVEMSELWPQFAEDCGV